MDEQCRDIQEQIPELLGGSLPEGREAELTKHLKSCPVCSQYCQRLQADDRLLGQFARTMQPSVAKLEREVIKALQPVKPGKANAVWRWRSRLVWLAAASVIVLAAGYSAGRFFRTQELDAEQVAALESQIRENVVNQLNREWAMALKANREELERQFENQMNEYAVETLAVSSAATNQLLTELIGAINTAQREDRQWVTAALEQMEMNRLRDNAQLQEGLQRLAFATEDELIRTKQDMARWISYGQPDTFVPEESKNFSPPKRKE